MVKERRQTDVLFDEWMGRQDGGGGPRPEARVKFYLIPRRKFVPGAR